MTDEERSAFGLTKQVVHYLRSTHPNLTDGETDAFAMEAVKHIDKLASFSEKRVNEATEDTWTVYNVNSTESKARKYVTEWVPKMTTGEHDFEYVEWSVAINDRDGMAMIHIAYKEDGKPRECKIRFDI